MTNFAACKPKRSLWKQNATLAGDTLSTSSRETNRTRQSVLSNRTRFPPNSTPNGNQTNEWKCDTSIFSGHSSTALSNRPFSATSYQKHPADCCCNGNGVTIRKNSINITERQSDQNSVVSSTYINKTKKCELCKEQIKFFKEEFLCGHVFHGECIWRYEKLNPTYLSNQCPKNCMRKLMTVKRTRSIESRSSSSSSSSNSSSSSSSSSSE